MWKEMSISSVWDFMQCIGYQIIWLIVVYNSVFFFFFISKTTIDWFKNKAS
jgi:hypothetical protein